ncbi:MAG TPA: protoglobin domain-containing protein [Candidatus Acidoferrales bacterium]|nr:protoglobin domain-containing protein [Candidatus Acidoferrales bacterium]
MADLYPLQRLGLDGAGRQRRLAFLDLGEKDEALLKELRDFARQHVDEIVEEFYAHLWTFEETRQILGDDATVARLKNLQRAYFLRLTDGQFDAEYFDSRLRVGDTHQRINLEPRWYIGTYNLYLRLLIDRLRDHYGGDAQHFAALVKAVSKVIFLDIGLAIDAYITGGYVERELAQEYRRIAEVAERTLQEKAEVERMKTDLTNMIVHDLKGPIGGILTVAQLALRKRGGSAESNVKRFEQIQRSARDLLRMIENLLEIDQMEGERLELRVEPVDIGSLLGECADEYHAAAEMAGQTIAVSIGDDVPVIATDLWLLRRVLNNLVVNAIRHSGTMGCIELAAQPLDGNVEIRVRDSGRGLSFEDQAILFQKDRSELRRGENRDDTGLGLVFCKMATEVMGGKIAVESEPGKGATFIVTLPGAGSD